MGKQMTRMKNKEPEAKGSITIYLSLCLLILLSLIFTIIEGARVSVFRVYGERALSTAMDSVLAEYYGPLWQEYHIFGYDSGGLTDFERRKELANKLNYYMAYTFDPNKEPNSSSFMKVTDLLDINIDVVEVNDVTRLMDYKAKLYIHEAVEYAKYSAIGNGMEALLDKFSLLETPKKLSIVYDKKLKAEEELVEIDTEILQLMRLLDGIKTGKKDLKTDRSGQLLIEQYFIKKICYATPSKEATGINHDIMFERLRSEYVNPSGYFESINNNLSSLETNLAQIKVLEAALQSSREELSRLQSELSSLQAAAKAQTEAEEQGDENNQTEENGQIKALEDAIKSVEEVISEYRMELTKLKEEQAAIFQILKTDSNSLSSLIDHCIPLIQDAKKSIQQIIKKAKEAGPFILEYEETLNREKESLPVDIHDDLEQDLHRLKGYTSKIEGDNSYYSMLEILDKNLAILQQAQAQCSAGRGWITDGSSMTAEHCMNAKKHYSMASEYLRGYQIKGLTLDYSTLVIEKDKAPDPLSKINELFASGITSLILDPAIISDKEITTDVLPSEIMQLAEEDKSILTSITDFFKNADLDGGYNGMGNLFSEFGSSADVLSWLGDSVNIISEHLLYQEYIKEHFEAFPVGEEKSDSRKPSVLMYEQEYLLAGKRNDEGNLNTVIQKILLLRLICNFITILGNKDKINEAKAAAAALVGFTGLPILVSITQTIILLIWSFAEALLDLNSIMMGKAVPILKKKIHLQLPELFILSRSFLQGKASKLADTKEISFTYSDYIYLFLLMSHKQDTAYKSLDLIQENLRIRYDKEDFDISNCIFGFRAKTYLHIKPKLTGIRFVQRYLGSKGDNYNYVTDATYSY